MAFQLNKPRYRKYKFFGNNLWGRLFVSKKFRSKDVIFARISKKLTLKAISVNPVKLRQKRKSFRTLCLYSSLALKRYYHNMRETQFRRILRKSVKGVVKKLIRTPDRLLTMLELRLDGLLLKMGLFSHPAQIRHFVRYGHILVNGQKVNFPSVVLDVGSIISFANTKLAFLLLHNFIRSMIKLKVRAKRLKVDNYHFLYFPLIVANRVCYLHLCYRTLTIAILDKPTYSRNVYYPFVLDAKKVLAGYPYVR